ncbi:hypothetical protein JYP49_07435 [Nitratireductor aquimarinus]|uniref:TadE/TadG family type IV pilus assembly protein n=1 Tax=Nitratireductor TaxID=245876 RepID=UPI0019D40EE5|nr:MULTISPECIES: hypothetical protein [Nitratireductor]MBN7777081.1 hypothetical protein [Nitratireductor pacificus]MBN7780414.1 hypothetical protein [Nitratireductor pacificus]MBN7789221.1 hypothetical protein [Nitratireductor aquimarinus]MBY6099290.1 hypothetical protein [Nitratireductor aquimarinus]MCA1259768.1 hypothetical protein [Nitratireductor aquimarinus]
MRALLPLARRFVRDTRANVATLFALFLPIMIGCLALAVDYGNLTLQSLNHNERHVFNVLQVCG